jgi:DNA uptake protein ComE-like DNA-binding protein
MKKSILFTLALGLFTSFSPAAPAKKEDVKPVVEEAKKTVKDAKDAVKDMAKDPKAPAKEAKPAAKDAKEEAKPAAKKPATPKSKQKVEELSEADKALVAGAKKQVDGLTAAQKAKLLELANKGTAKDITAVNGLGDVKAKAIIDERPFTNGEDLIMVDGIGEGTFGNIITYIKGDQDKPAAATKDDAKTKETKEAPKADKKETPAPKKKAA